MWVVWGVVRGVRALSYPNLRMIHFTTRNILDADIEALLNPVNILPIFIIFLSSCSISGLYVNEKVNKNTPDALALEICDDQSFSFYIWHHVLGEGIETGKWSRSGDNLYLSPSKQYQTPETEVIAKRSNIDNIRLKFYAIHANGDTLTMGVLDTLLVDEVPLLLDSTGTIKLPSLPKDSIRIRPFIPDIINLQQTAFLLDPVKNDIEFYLSRGEWQPFSYYLATGPMLIKNGKLYDIDSFETVRHDAPWKRKRRGCGYISKEVLRGK